MNKTTVAADIMGVGEMKKLLTVCDGEEKRLFLYTYKIAVIGLVVDIAAVFQHYLQ